jgi:hypothetical protein
MTELVVILTGCDRRTGRYDARIPALGRGVCLRNSRTPFLDAARALVNAGFDPNSMLVMRRAAAGPDCLRGRIGPAAKLTVKETPNGPVFASWKPFPSNPVAPGIEQSDSGVTQAQGVTAEECQ